MKQTLVSLLLAAPVVVSIGCKKPDLDYSKLRVGMTKKEVIYRVGEPTRTTVQDQIEVWEYEAFDRYGAIAINPRSQFVRFVGGLVEFFGTREELAATKPSAVKVGVDAKTSVTGRPEAAAPRPAAFDLRSELEKLEAMKKDGLITEAEFKELRQKVLDKAKAQ